MHKLCKLIEQESLEIDTAEDYISCALKTEGSIRSVYKELAKDELEHVSKLIEIGDDYRYDKESKEHTIWEFEKERVLEAHSKLLARLSQIK